jgi:hypothetical protein
VSNLGSQEIVRAYVNFAENLRDTKSDLVRQPSKKVLGSARRVRALLVSRIAVMEPGMFGVMEPVFRV